MLDSDDLPIALSHHLAWIHNTPKCESCLVMDGRGRGRHPGGVQATPFPQMPVQSRGSHPAGARGSWMPSNRFRTFPEFGGSRSSGDRLLPDISEAASIRVRPGYDASRAGVAHRHDAPLRPLETSHFLPEIANIGHGRMSKSLDSSDRLQRGVKHETTVSLPSLASTSGVWSVSDSSVLDSGVSDASTDKETLLGRSSLEEDYSESEDDEERFAIDPFPFQSERTPYERNPDTLSVKPPSPPPKSKKKKKKKKEKPPPPPKRRPSKARRPYQRKRTINYAALRRHEQEVAKKHPVKKQFFYSTVLEGELQSYIPPRLPGGKLKPVYKRSQTGDILIPEDPISVEYTQLDEGAVVSDSPWQITRRRQEALQTFLDRRKKLQKHAQMSKSKGKRVRFTLPPGHVNSASEDEVFSDSKETQDAVVGHRVSSQESERGQGGVNTDGGEQNRKDSASQEQRDNDGKVGEDAILEGQSQSSGHSVISQEALREFESAPSHQESEQLVHDWLKLQTADDNHPVARVSLLGGTSSLNAADKLPQISEIQTSSSQNVPVRMAIVPEISITNVDNHVDQTKLKV